MGRSIYDRADLLAIAAGGVAGAALRWLITRTPQRDGHWFTYAPNDSATLVPADLFIELDFPSRTFTANILGCLLLGGLTVILARQLPRYRRLLVAAATGFCGSLTTFSTFAVEVAERFRGLPAQTKSMPTRALDYGPEASSALTYLVVSLVGGALAFWLGRTFVQRIVDTPGVSTIGGGE